MPRNPYYDKDWHSKLSLAEAILTAARQDEAEAATVFASPRHRAAMATLKRARAEQRAAWRLQFETVADYAAWRFGDLAEGRDGFAVAHRVADFTSLEEVDAAYEHA